MFLIFMSPTGVGAQVATNTSESDLDMSTSTVVDDGSATATAERIITNRNTVEQQAKDTTQPEQLPEKVAILELFEQRPVTSPGFFSFMAYWVQSAVQAGVPANTIFLILITAIMATLVSFIRIVIGLPTIGMLVPIALAYAFVALGVFVGLYLLAAIILASYVSKMMLKRLKIMYYPKRSLSMFLLVVFTLGALSLAAMVGYEAVLGVSIFPIIILILMGDDIVSVQLYKSAKETLVIASTTLLVGLTGYALASSDAVRDTLLLYPELVLLTVPANILIGRYFGLRIFEVFRFNEFTD